MRARGADARLEKDLKAAEAEVAALQKDALGRRKTLMVLQKDVNGLVQTAEKVARKNTESS